MKIYEEGHISPTSQFEGSPTSQLEGSIYNDTLRLFI